MQITRDEFVRQLDRSGLLSLQELEDFEKELSSGQSLGTVHELARELSL